ncbi:Crp/Fnr family transcriptional regulator [Methylopila turkensis]|uniref:Cyclic nucleotide-binding protein n=1 Tax=Methylopila turkensis TaxID=1437816 RepID=A0A9W6JQJ5_9HYPH|nr:Crp/Fnr family transcriptional regulator [Methylopila turkensis]GLK80519.1 cyclic nucleotide-binding protein [Methylopila turkensis]
MLSVMRSIGRQKAEPLHPLLARLDADGRSRVVAHLRAVEHRRGALLTEIGQPIRLVHLVEHGLIAIVGRDAAGASAEAGLVGPGGLIGVAATLGLSRIASRDAVSLSAARTLAIDVTALEHVVALYPEVRRDLSAYAGHRHDQTARLCVCAALHTVEQRIARWLLEAAALCGGGPLDVTHAQFSNLLGVRRASITSGLHVLEGEQAIRCRRGQIEIRDMDGLARRSCGCERLSASERRSHTA